MKHLIQREIQFLECLLTKFHYDHSMIAEIYDELEYLKEKLREAEHDGR
jgi:hypothetical protein